MPRPGDLVEARMNPGEAVRALAARHRWLESIGWPPDPAAFEQDRRAVEAGTYSGAIWIGPKDEAAALVTLRPGGPGVLDARPFLMEGYRSLGALRALIAAIERSSDRPIVLYRIEGTNLSPGELAPLLEPMGFRRFERYDMRYPPERALPSRSPPLPGLRLVRPEDEAALGELLYDAYLDFPLDPALLGDGTDRAGAAAAVHQLLDGTYGGSWTSASFVVERDGRLVAAVVANDHFGPLISEVMVARDHRRQGLARSLLVESLTVLRRETRVPPRLVVTAANGRARRVYGALGFELVPLPPDSTWFNPERRGRPELLDVLPPV